jgi:tRNA-2-methylthio-N6-dimethylallyladenosine synthase
VDLVMGPRHIAQLGPLLDQARAEGRSIGLARGDEPMAFPSETAARMPGPRAYVTIMEGCNKTCTFCIVPYTRGREVYRPAAEIVREARDLVARGYCEIELLGQNVNAWREGERDLAALLRMIDRVPGVRRLRFTTSHPGHLSLPIMRAFREVPTVCNHLHLPAQSGSDRVLRAMRRGYTRSKYLAKIDYLRREVPEMAFSTDLIVGYPGESEGDFESTLELLRAVRFDQVYAFAYSRRPGTSAASATDGVPEEVKAARLQRLFAVQEEILEERQAALVGRTFEILIDGPSRLDAEVAKGRTRCNRIVHVPAAPAAQRGFLKVRIARAHAHSLTGEPVASGPSA